MPEIPNIAEVLQQQPWLERAIGAIAPSWELRRLQARVQKHLFRYQAAQADRIFAPKTTGAPAENTQTARDRVVMMFESRDLVENFGPAKVILSKFAENIAPTEYAPNTGDRTYDAQIAEYFHAWCKRCDFNGRHSFKKLVEIAVQTRPVDGDCGFIIRRMQGDDLRLQLVAGDRIGSPYEVQIAERYFSGFTVDGFGRPTSVRIYTINKNGSYVDAEEVPIANFLHYFDPFRIDQYRGVTDFHAVLQVARMLKNILDAEMVGVNYASQQAALVFNTTGTAPTRDLFTPSGAANNAAGNAPLHEESKFGFIKYLTRGDKVEVMPSRPGSAFEGFTKLLMDHFALGVCVPGGVLWGTQDYKGPSVRAEFAQADRTFSRHQGITCDKILDPAKEAVLLNGLAKGDIALPKRVDGETPVQTVRRMLRGTWRFPAKLTIDVGRESDAKINENVVALRSAQEIAAEENADAFERIEQNAQAAAFVKEMAAKYGVTEAAIRLPGKQLPSTPAAAAAIGEASGAAASEAQASASPKPEPPEPSDASRSSASPEDAEPVAASAKRVGPIRFALAGPAPSRDAALGRLLTRSQRLAQIREKMGVSTRTTSELQRALDPLRLRTGPTEEEIAAQRAAELEARRAAEALAAQRAAEERAAKLRGERFAHLHRLLKVAPSQN